MAADLHIHIKTENVTDRDLQIFFSSSLGSKYCHFPLMQKWDPEEERRSNKSVCESPNIWIGEVSWLKAALFEDGEDTFIPTTVQKVQDLIGENLPILDEKLIENIFDAFILDNKTSYKLADPREVVKFLMKYIGKPVFTVSW
jgi:hypothetical protein